MLLSVERPCSIGRTTVAKSSSRSTRSAASRRRRCRSAHGDADVGLVQRGAVVDPVARHRHDVALAASAAAMRSSSSGRHPSDNEPSRSSSSASRSSSVGNSRRSALMFVRAATRLRRDGRACRWSAVAVIASDPAAPGAPAIASATRPAAGPQGDQAQQSSRSRPSPGRVVRVGASSAPRNCGNRHPALANRSTTERHLRVRATPKHGVGSSLHRQRVARQYRHAPSPRVEWEALRRHRDLNRPESTLASTIAASIGSPTASPTSRRPLPHRPAGRAEEAEASNSDGRVPSSSEVPRPRSSRCG